MMKNYPCIIFCFKFSYGVRWASQLHADHFVQNVTAYSIEVLFRRTAPKGAISSEFMWGNSLYYCHAKALAKFDIPSFVNHNAKVPSIA
jgi:hypothetical protein